MTLKCYTAMTVIVDKIKKAAIIVIVRVDNNMKTNLTLSLLQVTNKPHDEVQFVRLFLSSMWNLLMLIFCYM